MKAKTFFSIAAAIITGVISGSCDKKSGTKEYDTETTNVMKTINLEGINAVWIQDNEGTHLMKAELFTEAPKGLIDSLGLKNGIPASMSTFLVESDSIRILFDTGRGASDSRLIKALQEQGLSPDDIEFIYLTHFHGDHIGGMLKNDSVVFPNARVYASRVEYEAWLGMPAEKNALVVKTMDAYRDNLHLFEFGDTLPGNVVAIDAVGHTPGHTAFKTGKLLVIGDLVHGAALQLNNPEICASYDMDKDLAVKTRIRLLQYAKENGLTMAGMHLPAPAFR